MTSNVRAAVEEATRRIQRGEMSHEAAGDLAYSRITGDVPPLPSEMRVARRSNDGPTIAQQMNMVRAQRALATGTSSPDGSATRRTPEYRAAWETLASGGHLTPFHHELLGAGQVSMRDASDITGSAGAYTVPQSFEDQLVLSLLNSSPVRQLAGKISTSNGRVLPYPIVDDTANAASILGENVVVNRTTDPVFASVSLGAFTWVAPAVIAPWSLFQDSALDIGAILARIAADRIVRGQEAAFITGSGSGTFLGLNAVTTGVTTASNAAITFDEWMAAWLSLRPAYRQGGASWLMHSNTYKAALDLKDSSNRYLFDHESGTMFGLKVYVDDNVAQIGASAKVAFVGRFDLGYVIRDVSPPTSLILHERYADSLASAVIVAQRTDATVSDAAALRALAMHS
jgi:HK97 family phage major capsid protein